MRYRNRFHEVSEKWIREHRQEYRGNRAGDLQDAYIQHVNQVSQQPANLVKSGFLCRIRILPPCKNYRSFVILKCLLRMKIQEDPVLNN